MQINPPYYFHKYKKIEYLYSEAKARISQLEKENSQLSKEVKKQSGNRLSFRPRRFTQAFSENISKKPYAVFNVLDLNNNKSYSESEAENLRLKAGLQKWQTLPAYAVRKS